jgi:hypothetical protein
VKEFLECGDNPADSIKGENLMTIRLINFSRAL